MPEKMLSGIKSDFFEFCSIPGVNRNDSFPSGKENVVTSYL